MIVVAEYHPYEGNSYRLGQFSSLASALQQTIFQTPVGGKFQPGDAMVFMADGSAIPFLIARYDGQRWPVELALGALQ